MSNPATPEGRAAAADQRSRGLWRSLHLVTLAAFAIGQPVLDILGRQPAFFTVRRSLPVEIIVQGMFWTLAPGLVIAGLVWLVGRLGRAASSLATHLAVAVLVAVMALPALNSRTSLDAWAALSIAGVSGVVATLAYRRWQAPRSLVSVASIALVIFPASFLMRPGISKVLSADTDLSPVATAPPALPIVLVIFDELPLLSLLDGPATIDPIRYPAFAELASRSTWYRNTATVSDFTLQAVPSILTARYPTPDALPIVPDHPESLMTLLGFPGAANISESVTNLCPSSICADSPSSGPVPRFRGLIRDIGLVALHLVTPKALAGGLPPIDQNWVFFERQDDWHSDWRQRARSDRDLQFDRFLAQIGGESGPDDRGSLHVLHLLQPHPPFNRLPSGHRYTLQPNSIAVSQDRNSGDPTLLRQAYQRHLLQLGYADRLLGRILAKLRREGLYERALIAVTADHGASFAPRAYRRHFSTGTAREIVAIPLLIKAPGQQRGVVDRRLVETVDILPTIAAHAGVEIPWPVDGRSLLQGTDRQHVRFFTHRSNSEEFFELGPDFAELESLIEAKNRTVGTGAELPTPFVEMRFQPFMGQPAARWTRPEPSSIGLHELRLLRPSLRLSEHSEFVPAHLTGEVRLPDPGRASQAHLAVAINGVLAGAAETLMPAEDLAPGSFSILLDEAEFHRGFNEFEIFEWIPPSGAEEADLQLAPIASTASLSSNLLTMESSGLVWQGLHGAETWPGVATIRWTDGHARLQFPKTMVPMSRYLRLGLISTGPDGGRLKIEVNGEMVFSEKLSKLPEDQVESIEIPLTGLAGSDWISTIELLSPSFVPQERFEGSVDERRLGVAVAILELADSPEIP